MNLSKLASGLGRAAVYARDLNAIQRGKAGARLWHRFLGRTAGRLIRKLY